MLELTVLLVGALCQPPSMGKTMIICSDLIESNKNIHSYPHVSFILTVSEKIAAFCTIAEYGGGQCRFTAVDMQKTLVNNI